MNAEKKKDEGGTSVVLFLESPCVTLYCLHGAGTESVMTGQLIEVKGILTNERYPIGQESRFRNSVSLREFIISGMRLGCATVWLEARAK